MRLSCLHENQIYIFLLQKLSFSSRAGPYHLNLYWNAFDCLNNNDNAKHIFEVQYRQIGTQTRTSPLISAKLKITKAGRELTHECFAFVGFLIKIIFHSREI